MYNLRPLILLLSLVNTSLAATLATLSSSSSLSNPSMTSHAHTSSTILTSGTPSTISSIGSSFSTAISNSTSSPSASKKFPSSFQSASTSLPTDSAFSSASTSITSSVSKAANTRSTGSISAQTSNASVSRLYLNESASAILSAKISRLAALRTNGSLLTNQSLTENFYERGPVVFSASTIIGTGGKYRVWLDLSLAALIVAAYHNSPWPKSDGEIPGDLPLCGGSPFVSYCTEIVAFSADNDADLAGRWSLTNAINPPVPPQQAETLARIRRFWTARGVFLDETETQQTSLLDGIFAGCENIDRVGPGLPVESYATFLGSLNDPLCTVASTSTATTTSCPTMTITYLEATAPPYTTTANVPAGDPRCRAYNPNVDFQPSGLCDAGLEWEGCQADASSWLGYFDQLTGPFSDPQGPGSFAAAMEAVQAPNWVWNVTLMGKPYCSAANALVEAPITSVGTTTASCQALPTQVQFGAVSINDLEEGFCANFHYASDCSGGMQTFCNRGSVSTSFEIVPA